MDRKPGDVLCAGQGTNLAGAVDSVLLSARYLMRCYIAQTSTLCYDFLL